ncbi:protein adenylyltransferase SelO [Ruixingdingia sedimenti]|uniref:Protein nucleotidyltransferase YdiU n=1 Tax=Ruixingdingia sedimenti TaxID=3073604 RepID=A0ABU1FDQ4_9RHOB|nr:YdiU family protein [Xinfangfangia sp. LG-4]MDR5655020.1 YdiU family protein [Xinfangfangia sp. LG-4]
MRFDNSYARLPERFYARQHPTPVAVPGLVAVNAALAAEMGLDPAELSRPEWVEVFAGNRIPKGADPLAQAYAGHQFGGWVPQLGDGRAILLGEILGPDGRRWDIQLKGAGRTPFSRMGDGRAWLGPVLREYLASEAMAALGVPTTRALAAVTTGEPVWREEGRLPGAVLCRVASSHIRVGTFQYFAARGDTEALRLLTDMAIARHHPGAEGALGLLQAAVAAQARLVAQWMALGFIHGVMNTDNAHVGGLTIDYGPCAFMDVFHPDRVFSSIDSYGRYAWSNQPQIAVWNMAQLASCLLPLIDPDETRAVALATEAVHAFAGIYQAEWLARFGAKIGLAAARAEDEDLIGGLLDLMAAEEADFTRAFRGLAEGTARDEFVAGAAFDAWAGGWQARLAQEPGGMEGAEARMAAANPAVIPRNHRVQEAITAAVAGDFAPFHRLHAALADPFGAPPDSPFRTAPLADQVVRRTFCGT